MAPTAKPIHTDTRQPDRTDKRRCDRTDKREENHTDERGVIAPTSEADSHRRLLRRVARADYQVHQQLCELAAIGAHRAAQPRGGSE
jgi:hypothetical protein